MSSNNWNGFHFRAYRPADFPRLCELDQVCFSEDVAYAPGEIALALAQPETFAVVAEHGEEVVAFVLALQRRRVLGHIITIDVHPNFRRRGIGDRLMELAQQHLREQGATRLILEVGIYNEPAIAFYGGRGFVRQRVLPRYYRDGSDAYLMEKAL